MAYFAHATAEIADTATVGRDARIWHQAQILAHASIGEGTVIGQGAFVDIAVKVGNRVKIQSYALLYRGTVVEDEAFIGPHVVITNDRRPRSTNPDGSLKKDADWHLEGAVVRKGASLGAATVVLPGVEVGSYAMVAAGAVVSSNVASHGLVTGVPARPVGWVCVCGQKLRETDWTCPDCMRVYARTGLGLVLRD